MLGLGATCYYEVWDLNLNLAFSMQEVLMSWSSAWPYCRAARFDVDVKSSMSLSMSFDLQGTAHIAADDVEVDLYSHSPLLIVKQRLATTAPL